MRILVVTYFFPPFNCIGALRPGKAAAYFVGQGHDIRVVTAAHTDLSRTLPVEIEESRIVRTAARTWWRPPHRGRQEAGRREGEPGVQLLGSVRKAVRSAVLFPDAGVSWIGGAARAGIQMSAGWRPDVIYATAPAFSALLAARRIAGALRVPLVAELRDLWVGNHYRDLNPIMDVLDRLLERRVLGSCAGIVTVSDQWTAALSDKYGKPAKTVLNGYDPADYPTTSERDRHVLRIGHFGQVYGGRRDPRELFVALRKGGFTADDVRVHFWGDDLEPVRRLAEGEGVRHLISLAPSIPFRESLLRQCEMDVLLLLMYDHPAEAPVLPGKLFEYLGAERPILLIGSKELAAARFVLQRDAGWVSQDSAALATIIRTAVERKKQYGDIPAVSRDPRLLRSVQFAELERFVSGCAGVLLPT